MDAEFLKEHSNEHVRLARVAFCSGPGAVADIPSIAGVAEAYAQEDGVVWIHWDVSSVRLEKGGEDAREFHDAVFLTRFLTEAFQPEEGDAVSEILRWRLNIVGTRSFGGLHAFEEEAGDDEGSICMFDADIFELAYAFPSEIKGEVLRELLSERWRRMLFGQYTLSGIAVPHLVVTIRNDGEPAYFEERVRLSAEEDDDELLSPSWNWSGAAIEKALERWSDAPVAELRSGDLLAALARECVESYEEIRSWLMAESEEVEVARLAPDVSTSEIDRLSLARRHHWLLEQASRARAGLDWSRDGWGVSEALFSGDQTRAATEERRRDLLAALTATRATLRSALDLVTSAAAAEQLELTRQEAVRSGAFQRAVTFVTTVLLAPGLVAAFFGALPSVLEDEPADRFVVLVASMVIAALASWLALRWITRQAGVGVAAGQDD